MKASHILMAAVSALGILAGAAHAGIETTFVHFRSVEIDSTAYNVYDMMVTPTHEWIRSKLDITLTSGSFYNDSFGDDTQPSAAFIAAVPTIEWDTYAATPGGEADKAKFTPDSQFGQNILDPKIPPGNTVIAAGWYDTANTGPGTFKVARLTLSSDAAGTIGGKSYNNIPGEFSDSVSFDGMYFIEGGHIVPEPPPPSFPPEAHAGGPYTILLGESVTLDAGQSTDPNYDIASYRWDLDGDEAFETDAGDQYAYEATPAHLAPLVGGGRHTISVLVTDGEGLSDTHETLLTIMIHGDANIDGFVDDDDLAVLLSNWTGPLGTGRTWETGDFDADGDVSDDDLAILLGNWTGAPPTSAAAVPEPATLALLALGGLAVMRHRRR